MIKYNKLTYEIFSVVSQIFELNKDTNRYRADEYSYEQLMLCEENSIKVDTLVMHGMVYINYTFKDESRALLIVIPPIVPNLKETKNED